jgi:hypothetical protein
MSLNFPHSIPFLNMPIFNHSLLGDHFISEAFPSRISNLCHVLVPPKQILIHVEYTQVGMAIESLVPDGRAEESDGEGVLKDFLDCYVGVILTSPICTSAVDIVSIENIV